MMKKALQRAYLATILLLLYLPILVLILLSFNDARYSLEWQGFSLEWYGELIHDRALWRTFSNSIFLGLCSATIATIIGCISCIHLFLWNFTLGRSLTAMLLIVIIIPDIVLGVALLLFFNLTGIPLGFLSLLIAHITFCLPFVILTINSRIRTIDPNIYFSGVDLGASHSYVLRKVLIPMLWPSILSGFLLCFTLSFDDVIVSYFVSGPSYSILPLTIFSLVRTGVSPELNALCSFTVCFSMLLAVIAHFLGRKKI